MDGCKVQKDFARALMLATCLALSADTFAAGAVAGLSNLAQGFTGQLVRYHKSHPYSQHITKITLTRHGSWLEASPMFPPSRPGVYIQNFVRGGAWVVDTEKRIYAALPDEPAEDVELAGGDLSIYGGIMATRPCADADEARMLRRQPGAEIWRCDYRGLLVEQRFDTRWGIVTREQWPDLTVTELRQLKAVDFGPAHFLPSRTYLEVSLREFFQGYAPLPPYDNAQLEPSGQGAGHSTQGGS